MAFNHFLRRQASYAAGPAMASHTTASQTLTLFRDFTRLPLELQDMIWKCADDEYEPRVFEWRFDYLTSRTLSAPGVKHIGASHAHPPPGSRHPIWHQVSFGTRETAKRWGLREVQRTAPMEETLPGMVAWIEGADDAKKRATGLPHDLVALQHARDYVNGRICNREEVHYLFNMRRDILYIRDPEKSLPVSDAITHRQAAQGPLDEDYREIARLPRISLTDAVHIAVGLPGSHVHSYDEEHWKIMLTKLRDRFKGMKALYLVWEQEHAHSVDSVTGELRGEPWLRDGGTAGVETTRRPATVTALVPATETERVEHEWGKLETLIQECWAQVCSESPRGSLPRLRVEVRYSQRDWAPCQRPLRPRRWHHVGPLKPPTCPKVQDLEAWLAARLWVEQDKPRPMMEWPGNTAPIMPLTW